jgi:hypothetical protein
MNFRLSCALVAAAALTVACAPATGYGRIVPGPSGEPAPTSSTSSTPPTSSGPPPPREVPTETHTGTGSGEFATSWPADQPAFLTFDCPKCSSNVMVETNGFDSLLVNAIGKYHGTTWFNITAGRPVTKVSVRADAPWTATVADFRSVPLLSPGKPTPGKGDAVFRAPEGVTQAAFTAKGSGHVALWVTVESSVDLLVNEIGDQQRTVDVPGPAFLRVDDWKGSWTITPS